MDPYIGEVAMFGGGFAPSGWMLCAGQLLSIDQYPQLFSAIGTTYGGDGMTNFSLPDLRGRVVTGYGEGPGLDPIKLGQRGGADEVALTDLECAEHTHAANCTTELGNRASPKGAIPAAENSDPSSIWDLDGPNYSNMAATMVQDNGQGEPVDIRSPSLAINSIICYSVP